MNKKILIYGGICLLVLLLIGLFIFSFKKDNNSDNQSEEQEQINSYPELQSDLNVLNDLDSELENTDSEIIEID